MKKKQKIHNENVAVKVVIQIYIQTKRPMSFTVLLHFAQVWINSFVVTETVPVYKNSGLN